MVKRSTSKNQLEETEQPQNVIIAKKKIVKSFTAEDVLNYDKN